MTLEKRTSVSGAVLAGALLLAALGCTGAPGTSQPGMPPTTATPPPEEPEDGLVDDMTGGTDVDDIDAPGVPEEEPPPTGMELHDAVYEALDESPDVDVARIGIRVSGGGTVYLSGEVGSDDERERAREIAQGVVGVNEVVIELEVR